MEAAMRHVGPERAKVGDREVLLADPSMRSLYALVRERLARAALPVLVQGETGTGKELVAQALHSWSERRARPFVALNCGAMPDTLIESELFGFEPGAFSGALHAKPGLVETADQGTLFLDEIGDLSLPAQAKVLRVLEEQRFRRLGATEERGVQIRIVAASHVQLERAVRERTFRRDLYYRLKGAFLHIPPLRRRPADLEVLAEHFLAEACRLAGRPPMKIAAGGRRALFAHRWPGNVRELSSALAFVAVTSDAAALEAEHVAAWVEGLREVESTIDIRVDEPAEFRPIHDEIAELERQRMSQALAAAEGNRTRAAQLIHMPLRTFSSKLKQYGLLDAEVGRSDE